MQSKYQYFPKWTFNFGRNQHCKHLSNKIGESNQSAAIRAGATFPSIAKNIDSILWKVEHFYNRQDKTNNGAKRFM